MLESLKALTFCGADLLAFFVKCYHGGFFAYLGLGVSALILLYEQILVARDYKNIPKAFFVSNGYLGVVFFIFIVFDVGFKHA